MTSRYSTIALVGTVASVASTAALVLFRLYESGVPVPLMRTMRFYDLDGQLVTFIGVTHLAAVVLAVFALIRPGTPVRALLAVVASLLAAASSAVVYEALYILFWSNVVFLCMPSSACNPDPGETALVHSLVFFGLFAAFSVLLAILNRRGAARDTTLRIGLLLLAVLPFLSLIGLIGTLLLSFRGTTLNAAPADRVLVDA